MREPDGSQRRRRPVLALVIVVALLAILAVVAVVVDSAVRSIVEDRVRGEVRTALALPGDASLDVVIGGDSMLLQLMRGTLDRVEVASDSVTFGELTGPLDVVALGVPVDTTQPVEVLEARFAASEDSLTRISGNLSGLPISAVTFAGDEIDIAAEFETPFVTLRLGVGLAAAADDGQIAFTPTSIRLGDADFNASDLRSRFGVLADTALQTRSLCIAEFLPRALRLDSVQVAEPRMLLTFSARNVALDGADLAETGTC